jgi:hypothetical protein
MQLRAVIVMRNRREVFQFGLVRVLEHVIGELAPCVLSMTVSKARKTH